MRVNILGFGTMGRQLVALFEGMGYDVSVWCRRPSDELRCLYKKEKKLFSKKLSNYRDGGTLSFADELSGLAPGLTVESLIENLEIKKQILQGISYSFDDIDLFSNSSSYAPAEIHSRARALHFFNPIHTLRIVEMTCGEEDLTQDGVQLIKDLRALGIEIVRAQENRGFIGNFILFQEISAALKLVDRYHYPSKSIDQVMERMGRSTSLFDVIDFVGIDVVKRILENLRESDNLIYVSPLLGRALELNILGRKNRTSIRELIDSP